MLAAQPSHAGPTLDEALARHRALLDGDGISRGATSLDLDPGLPDSITGAAGGPGRRVPPLLRPEARGDGGLQLRLRNDVADSGVRVRLGAAYWPGETHAATLDESSISVPFVTGRLYASVERRHWGPAWAGSLILDGGAYPVPAVGWRKAEAKPFESPWLSWLGPWSADVFAGELAQRTGPRHPKLFGARLQWLPLPGLELGFSRTLQWGGKGRPETLSSFWHALVGDDNTTIANDPNEPGNQLAGYDARYTYRFDPKRSVSIYGQMIGEDEAHYLPSRFLGTFGADFAWPVGTTSLRAFVEHADTLISGIFATGQPGGYQHHIYTDGYTQLGRPLGQPIGGDARLTSAGVYVDAGAWTGALMLHAGHAYPTATLYPGGGRLFGANGELAWQATPQSRIGLSLMHWRDPREVHNRAQAWWRYVWQ